MLSTVQLARKSLQYRKDILRHIKHAGAGHTGGSLSSTDILNVLYNRILRITPATRLDPARDRYIQSKGHCVEALYVVLADCGFFPASDLATLCGYQSDYVGHPTRHIAGVEQNTGALGHGLPLAIGTALAATIATRARTRSAMVTGKTWRGGTGLPSRSMRRSSNRGSGALMPRHPSKGCSRGSMVLRAPAATAPPRRRPETRR